MILRHAMAIMRFDVAPFPCFNTGDMIKPALDGAVLALPVGAIIRRLGHFVFLYRTIRVGAR